MSFPRPSGKRLITPLCFIAWALLRNRFRKTILRSSASAMIAGQLPEITTSYVAMRGILADQQRGH